jgi:DHA1 family multidrug resistance protein-like MFS transporter
LWHTYTAIFREHPFLVPFAVVTGAGQAAFALVNIYALPRYLVEDLHVSGLALGAASATFLLSETILKFPLGRLSDRLGRKPFIMLGPLVVCLNPVFFMALPARLWFLIFPLRVADGVGAAALWPPLFAAVGDLVKDRSRAAAMSVMNTVYVAAVGGALVIGSIAVQLSGSDRFPFFIASGLLVATAATAYLGFPRVPASEIIPTHDPDGKAVKQPRWGVMNGRLLVLVLMISFVMSAGVLILSNFLVLYLEIDMAFTPLRFMLLLAGLAVAVLALGLPLGHAADRWGTSKAVRLSLAVSALTMWLIPSCRSMASLAPVATVLVLSHILGTPAWLAVVSQLAPRARRGGVMGLVATGEGVGAVVGPLLGGWLWDMHHPWIFYGSAALLSLAAALAFTVLPKLPSVTDDPQS